MGLQRTIECEFLDRLPASDPGAKESRRNLQRLNMLMGHAGIFKSVLLKFKQDRKPASILELGAGDGTLMLAIARRLAPFWSEINLTLLDRHQLLSDESRKNFAALRWNVETVTADVFSFLDNKQGSPYDIILANLFLHHFGERDLAHLFEQIASLASLFVAVEPRRNWRALIASRALWAIGCNDITQHDAQVSVRAGFTRNELSQLWPKLGGWELRDQARGLFSHCFVARHDT